MNKFFVGLGLCICLVLAPTKKSHAIIWEVARQALIAAIKAADLAVQRLQNKTIWLQNAQKEVENILTKLKLDEISDWTKKHKEQYQQYFDELNKVKQAISGYKRVKEIINKQIAIVDEYNKAFQLFRRDKHFTPQEIDYMTKVYTGIIDESVKNIDNLFLVINSFTTKMTDGKRIEILNSVAESIDVNLNDLRSFNNENKKLVLQRARDQKDVEQIKLMYGIK
ncbi:conjugal transfer protein TraI [Chitinophaga varians]|uniref:Conjugal transfer protein TraI n=1 Tax=Chitinophaga varians TaxID=2202339 RepID=A0A847RJX6_9BACT|nr:conjugal transfer protein TraI [Chitinophaga varians]NLR67319.1 conjugal transfer protein TraI [Chitinophaga varians]